VHALQVPGRGEARRGPEQEDADEAPVGETQAVRRLQGQPGGLRRPVRRPSQADSSWLNDASSGGSDASTPICAVLARRNTAKAEK